MERFTCSFYGSDFPTLSSAQRRAATNDLSIDGNIYFEQMRHRFFERIQLNRSVNPVNSFSLKAPFHLGLVD